MRYVSANNPLHLQWRTDQVAKLMRHNKINDRGELAERIHQPYSTLCENLSTNWSGRVKTISILVSICQTFDVDMHALVVEPRTNANGHQAD